MEKEALLKIILQDIKELETLVTTFTGKKEIPAVFIQLAKNKTKGIIEEIDLLDGLKKIPFEDEPSTNPHLKPEEVAPAKQETISKTTSSLPQEEKKEPPKKSQTSDNNLNKEEEEETIKRPIDSAPAKEGSASVKTETNKEVELEKKEEINKNKVIGDIIGKEKQSFNEFIGKKNETGSQQNFHQPLNDLKKAFGINDRFFYQRELFGGNSAVFNQTLEQLNEMESLESANNFLSANFNWDNKNEAVISFKEIVKRRFNH